MSNLRHFVVRRRFLLVVCVMCLVLAAGIRAQQVQPAAAVKAPTIEEVLVAVRADLQAGSADILAKNMTLTSEQAAKFWPVFEAYQKEQSAIMDDQMKGIQQYVDSFEKLDDAAALGLIKAHLDRDRRITALRDKWLGEFQKVLPTKLAVRAMQIERRLALVRQVEFASQIPLVH